MIKKAILTGGGRATRLHPITTTTNKHLLPLANKAMIVHAIEKVRDAGIEEIFINTNPGEKSLQEFLGDGSKFGVKIKFFEQNGGPQGIAHVVNEAKEFIGDDPFMFYLSDNILLGGVKEMVEDFNQGDYDCMLALSEVTDPQRFGVPYFGENGELLDVIEKPENPPNNLAVTGIYLYGPRMFFDTFQNIEKSDRGEYEISSIHSHFLKNNKKVGYKEITGWWKDTGKKNDLIIANRLLLEAMSDNEFSIDVELEEDTVIEGNVAIGKGTIIGKNVKIIGPVVIGENCVLENCVVGSDVSVEKGVEIKKATITNSVVLSNAKLNCNKKITDSMIGRLVELVDAEEKTDEYKMILGDKTVIEF